jgi:diguanylate cyclase
MSILLDILFLLLAALGGAAAASAVWWRRLIQAVPKAPLDEVRLASETLGRLQELTFRVAAEVDQHANSVEEISAQLAADDHDEAAVIAAVTQLIDANRRMKRQLDTAEERLQTQAVELQSHAAEARTDPLTLVANRRALDDELARCVAEFERRGTPTTLMLLDVDHFKRFNDAHGHQAGDDALKTVARIVRQHVGEVGLVARYGGEEFAIVLAGLDLIAATPYCERARQGIAATSLRLSGREARITASAGVAQLLAKETASEMLGRADAALYASKSAGRNCAHLHDGRSCRLLRHASALPAGKRELPSDARIGDEWLYGGDINTEALFEEPIANVASRPVFFDEMIRRLGQCRKSGTPLAVALIQVDAYARIASDYGATAADAVLRIAAQLINASMRDMDHVTRLSEDTFALLLPGAALADAVTITERLRLAVERCRLPRRAGANWFTISVGTVQAGKDDDLRGLLERGRAALTDAVNQGRNCVVSHETDQRRRQAALVASEA